MEWDSDGGGVELGGPRRLGGAIGIGNGNDEMRIEEQGRVLVKGFGFHLHLHLHFIYIQKFHAWGPRKKELHFVFTINNLYQRSTFIYEI